MNALNNNEGNTTIANNAVLPSRPVLRQAYYFVNEETEETTWEAPTLPSAADGAHTGAVEGVNAHADGAGETATALTSWTESGDGGRRQEEHALVLPPADFQFPFYMNDRGNRVFCVPRKPGS